MRACKVCGFSKPDAAFNRRQAQCKECQREYRHRYYAANKERINAKARRWASENPERRREINRDYARRNIDIVTRWQREHPEERRAVARAYAQRKPDVVKRNTQTRRARLRGAFDEVVDLAVVRERDSGLCGICREPVTPEEESLDHVVPLAKGGRHRYENVQLAHLSCNKRKNDGRGEPEGA